MVNHLNRQTRSDPPIKRGPTINSIREGLEKFQREVHEILTGERVERHRSIWERMNDWCEDQLISWGDALDNHMGLWVVILLVILVLGVSLGLTLRLM